VKKTLGVEDGTFTSIGFEGLVEDTIQNGVKHTMAIEFSKDWSVEDTLQNGIKETYGEEYHHRGTIDGVIKNGIKETIL
jgi:hypothetical protein